MVAMVVAAVPALATALRRAAVRSWIAAECPTIAVAARAASVVVADCLAAVVIIVATAAPVPATVVLADVPDTDATVVAVP